MAQLGERVDATGASSQHQAVDHSTGLGSVSRIAEQPRLSSGRKNSDVAFQNIVIDRHPAVADVVRQIGIAELGIRYDFRRDSVEQ